MERAVERLGAADHCARAEHDCGKALDLGAGVPIQHDRDLVGKGPGPNHQRTHGNTQLGTDLREFTKLGVGAAGKQRHGTELQRGELVTQIMEGPCAPGRCHGNM